jgi:hypothetical protein
MEKRRSYHGDRAEAEEAFRGDSAALAAYGWRPAAMEWGESQLIVTYRYREPVTSRPTVGVRELWKPFAAGIVLGALILGVLLPALYLASH